MTLSRRILRPACRILIGALLFAQAAFAARPCVESDMSAAAAVAVQSNHNCCEPAVAELNLCAAQCGDSSKLPGNTDLLSLHPVTATGPVIPRPQRDNDAAMTIHQHLQRGPAADPPPILRFCRLLI